MNKTALAFAAEASVGFGSPAESMQGHDVCVCVTHLVVLSVGPPLSAGVPVLLGEVLS